MSESEYESESDDETYLFYNEIHKFNYFNRCDKCIPVKNMQKILLGKCDVLHSFKNQIVDYYGCDKCCKLRNLIDDYILPFTKLNRYPEYDEVHKMKIFIVKEEYTLEIHSEMKTMYENLDTFDFYKWHQEKKNYFKDVLCGYFHYYHRVSKFFIEIIYHLHYYKNRNKQLHCAYLQETSRFLNEMIVQNSQ